MLLELICIMDERTVWAVLSVRRMSLWRLLNDLVVPNIRFCSQSGHVISKADGEVERRSLHGIVFQLHNLQNQRQNNVSQTDFHKKKLIKTH
jgi:hypothetical protein